MATAAPDWGAIVGALLAKAHTQQLERGAVLKRGVKRARKAGATAPKATLRAGLKAWLQGG